jgi:hypothetical protein
MLLNGVEVSSTIIQEWIIIFAMNHTLESLRVRHIPPMSMSKGDDRRVASYRRRRRHPRQCNLCTSSFSWKIAQAYGATGQFVTKNIRSKRVVGAEI